MRNREAKSRSSNIQVESVESAITWRLFNRRILVTMTLVFVFHKLAIKIVDRAGPEESLQCTQGEHSHNRNFLPPGELETLEDRHRVNQNKDIRKYVDC